MVPVAPFIFVSGDYPLPGVDSVYEVPING
jgi:hypothetical protein